MKKPNRFLDLYYKLRYRHWAVVDIQDKAIIYSGKRELCDLVQDTQYAGLIVLPYNHAVTYLIASTVAEVVKRYDKR